MDNHANLDVLLTLSETAAQRQVVDTDFPPQFNLRESGDPMGHRLKYIKLADQAVVAIQLKLEAPGFTHRRSGGDQRCKTSSRARPRACLLMQSLELTGL